ncbi:MAG: IPT/TIG domain-containing protein [Acidobacteriota bacterium]|nr:IPT/TIG domain-containing protein [Acidobacteriota bacterium]
MSSNSGRNKSGRGPLSGCASSENACPPGKARYQPLLCLLAAVFVWWNSHSPALAFVPFLSGAKWKTFPVVYKIHQGGLPATGNRSEFVAVHAGFEAWETLEDSAITFSYGGTTETRAAALDYTNVISFQDDSFDFSSGVVAVTLTFYFRNVEDPPIVDADILFNPNQIFSSDGARGTFDLQSIATHEIGHLLGLDHTAIVSATMNPTAGLGVTFFRVLQTDDRIGCSVLYPEPAFSRSTGGIEGSVLLDGEGVFGAHVVALDEEGRAVTSALSGEDGNYRISGLPAGSYTVYAEPLDGPVMERNIIKPRGSADFNTRFATTFLGSGPDSQVGDPVAVSAGSTLTGQDIPVSPPALPHLNLDDPFLGTRLHRGEKRSIRVFGDGLGFGSRYFLLGEGIVLESPRSIGGSGAEIQVNVEGSALLGSRSLFVEKGDVLAALSGGLEVTEPGPEVSGITPRSGPRAGGTSVTVTGSNFDRDAIVSLDGIPLNDQKWLNSGMIQGTTGPNGCGSYNLLVINPDGSSDSLQSAFDSVSPAPTIDSVTPGSAEVTSTVTISGRNFDPVAEYNRVRFNNHPAEVISATVSRIVTLVPFGATSGPVTVEVCGKVATSSEFTVLPLQPSRNRPQPSFSYLDLSRDPEASRLEFRLDEEEDRTPDDSFASVALPFKFVLFTRAFPEGSPVNISTNGWVSLTPAVGGTAEWENGRIPGHQVPRPDRSVGQMPANLIAPFFHDLVVGETDSAVYTRVLGEAPDRRLIIEWKNFSAYDDEDDPEPDYATRLTFQAVLYEGSNDIAFLYRRLQGPLTQGESATIGLQNDRRDRAIQFGFNRPRLSEGRSLFFRFNPEDGSYAFEQFLPLVTDTEEFRTNLGLTADILSGATVELTLFDPTGQPLGSRTESVSRGGLIQLNHLVRRLLGSGSSKLSNVSGSVLVSSDQMVFPYVTQIDNRSSDPSLDLGAMSGGTRLGILSTTSVNQFRSSLVVLNVGDTTADVSLIQRDGGGRLLHRQQVAIPARGQFQSPDLHADLGISKVSGPLEIQSTNGVPLIATSRVYALDSGTSGFFRGLDLEAASGHAVIPISRESGEFRSNLGITNLSGQPARVQVQLFDSAGTRLGMTSQQVPPFGLVQLNRVNRRLSGSGGGGDTLGWIQLDADRPVAGFVSQINNQTSDPGFARSDVLSSTKLLIPSATNVNQFRSTITIVNAGNGGEARVRVRVRNRQGQIIGESRSRNLPPNGIFHLDDLLGSLEVPSNFGPVEIESLNGVPLLAVSRVYSINDDTGGFFLAQPF